jgi:hypothetical protein
MKERKRGGEKDRDNVVLKLKIIRRGKSEN